MSEQQQSSGDGVENVDAALAGVRETHDRLRAEISKVVVGQDEVVVEL